MPSPRLVRSLAALLLAIAPGCGEPARAPASPEGGSPTWSATRDQGPRDGVLIDLHADAPCRVRLRVLGAPEGPRHEAPRLLAAGEVARLWVAARVEPKPSSATAASASDAADGRSEAWVSLLTFGWEDEAGSKHVHVIGTRPGRGRALGSWTVAPSPLPATLPYERDLELASTAIADGGGELVLEGRESGSRVRGPWDAAAGDRVTLLRLVVRLERMGP